MLARSMVGIMLFVLAQANVFGAPGADPNTVRYAPSPLLAIDQHRATVIEQIVAHWGAPLEQSQAGLDSAQLRVMLQGMRADHLLAASLAGTLDGLRDVIAQAMTTSAAVKPAVLRTKTLGDPGDDLVYTPVAPCRLFDTRPSQNGAGILQPNVVRTYSATVPVPQQGGPGGCAAPAGIAVAMIQINLISPPALGLLQGGATGTEPFANALLLYNTGAVYGATIPMPVAVANGQFDLIARYNGTDVAGDLLGYFKAPSAVIGTQAGIVWVAKSGGNYTSIQAAIDAAALVATATSPVLVKVGPGTYTEQVTLKDYVTVDGSGFETTTITYSGSGGTVIAGANSDVRNLAIVNDHNGTHPDDAIAIYQTGNSPNGFSLFSQVPLSAQGNTDNIAVYVTGGSMVIEGRGIGAGTLAGTGLAIGLFVNNTSKTVDVRVRNTTIFVNGASGYVAQQSPPANPPTTPNAVRLINSQLGGANTTGGVLCWNTYHGGTLTAFACL